MKKRMENEAGRSQSEALKNMLVAGLLAVFTLALYAQLLFTNRVFASGDILYYFYPYRALAAEALRQGELLLWNPYIFMGAPFLANPQAAVLYPLHWPLSFLTVTQQVYWSATLHTWILGMGGYALMRGWRQDRLSSLVTGLVLAGSGFYGGLLGHLNQMNGAAWLPWAVLVVERVRGELGAAGPDRFAAVRWQWWRGSGAATVGWLSLLVTFMLLAGHTQTVYINLFGVGAWLAAAGGVRLWQLRRDGLFAREHLAEPAVTLGVLGAACVLGAVASAAQLLPTLELSELGLRSGGLGYGEASSFSLRPLLLAWTLLPSYGLADLGVVFGTLGYTEYVAYVGLVGLALAAGALWQVWRRWRAMVGRNARVTHSWRIAAAGTPWAFGLFFAGLGLFLALGRWNPVYYLLYVAVPGFDLFRAPARWMMLYTLGMAVLAGVGSGLLHAWLAARWANRPPSLRWIIPALLIVLVAGDLIVAARALPHTQLTAPQAVYDVRTAPAHIRTESHADVRAGYVDENVDENVEGNVGPGAQGRFLSMSALAFDPGDMADYRRILLEGPAPSLTPATFHDLVVALKAQEILAPNLAMLWQIPGVDGFDGGTLPLQRYNEFLTLLIPPDRLVPDGRVREQLTQVPPAHLLDLLNVQYVITDKVHDLWFDGVYYDRQMGAVLAAPAAEADNLGPADIRATLHVGVPQAFPATHIDLIGALIPPPGEESPRAVEAVAAAPIARVTVYAANGLVETRVLTGGGTSDAHWADAMLDSTAVADAALDSTAVADAALDSTAVADAMLDSTAVADAMLDSTAAQQSGAVVAWTGVEEGAQAYRARLSLTSDGGGDVILPERLEIEATPGPLSEAGYRVHVQAITLYHAPTGMFLALTPSPAGRLQLVHSGDVKVYEQRDVLPRVYWVPHAVGVSDGAAALNTLARADFDPATGVVLESAEPGMTLPWIAEAEAWGGTDSPIAQEQAEVTLLAYAPERVAARVVSQSPGVLVVSDAYYPGWQAWVDDTPAHIYPANHLFRGVIVPPGDHVVSLRFRPDSFIGGLWWSGAGLVLIGGLLLFSRRRIRRG